MKRIALLTGGGDCPGLNAAIRAVVIKAQDLGYEVIGFMRGWHGLIDPPEYRILEVKDVEDIQSLGGTILLTSRINPYRCKLNGGDATDRHHEILRNITRLECDGVVVIGGRDTLGVASRLAKEGLRVVAIPKTIDNDVSETDFCFGFNTAINIATEAIDRLHTTARSHSRVFVVEIMGRHVGWMTLYAGIAGGAHFILIPEVPFSVREVCDFIKKRQEAGKEYSIIAVAEGALPQAGSTFAVKREQLDDFDHVLLGGVSEKLANAIQEETGIETRNVILGHIQRGGPPTTFDRVLASLVGLRAVELLHKKTFGVMVGLRSNEIVPVPLEEAISRLNTVPLHLYEEARLLFH